MKRNASDKKLKCENSFKERYFLSGQVRLLVMRERKQGCGHCGFLLLKKNVWGAKWAPRGTLGYINMSKKMCGAPSGPHGVHLGTHDTNISHINNIILRTRAQHNHITIISLVDYKWCFILSSPLVVVHVHVRVQVPPPGRQTNSHPAPAGFSWFRSCAKHPVIFHPATPALSTH